MRKLVTIPVALTGTPGTGKSSVARRLAPSLRSIEVGALALRSRAARRAGQGLEVDVDRLRSVLRRPRAWGGVDLVVGHLAHLLPVRDVIVLRCHPVELVERLRRSRRGNARDRRENFAAEALDVILWEAVRPNRRVWEVDTTHRPVAEVARVVERRVRRRGPSSYGRVDWLADPRVTAHLLDRGP
jgi:adenylate kinase